MVNSFYYFFSATPQVLGGVLALFGVFVVFKIQELKAQLIGLLQTLHNLYERKPFYDIIDLDQPIFDRIYQSLKIGNPLIPIKDVKSIKSKVLHLTADYNREKELLEGSKYSDEYESLLKKIDKNDSYFIVLNNFDTVFKNYESIINSTIKWSIFTASTIVICLSIIPFGVFLLDHPILLKLLFLFLIMCIAASFFGLVYILNRALKKDKNDKWLIY